jgi:hypothetical protein
MEMQNPLNSLEEIVVVVADGEAFHQHFLVEKREPGEMDLL